MLIIKLTRTQLLQQQSRKKEEKIAVNKKKSIPVKPKSIKKSKTEGVVSNNKSSKATKPLKKRVTKPFLAKKGKGKNVSQRARKTKFSVPKICTRIYCHKK